MNIWIKRREKWSNIFKLFQILLHRICPRCCPFRIHFLIHFRIIAQDVMWEVFYSTDKWQEVI
jgi:hypothetical protein